MTQMAPNRWFAFWLCLLACVTAPWIAGCDVIDQDDMRRMGMRRPPDPDEEDDAPPAKPAAPPAAPPPGEITPVEEASSPTEQAVTVVASGNGLSDTQSKPDEPLSPVERAQRASDNLERLAEAFMAYQARNKSFPQAAIKGVGGAPLLSWRVALLPYLGHQKLYEQFDLKQPWYAPQNKRLLKYIPSVYQSASRFDEKTHFRVPTGSSAIFKEPRSIRPQRVEDGLGNTVMLVETDEAVPWTEPREYQVDPRKPSAGLGDLRSGEVYLIWASGMVGSVPQSSSAANFKAMFTPDSGEAFSMASVNKPIDVSKLEQVAQEVVIDSPGDGGATKVVSRGSTRMSADMQTRQIADLYRRAAGYALQAGDHGPAWQWLHGAAALGAVSPDEYSWYPALRRPALGVHYGVALIAPERATGPGAVVINSGERTRASFLARTAPFGEPFLAALERETADSSLARLAPPPLTDTRRRRVSTRQIEPRVSYLGGGSLPETRRVAGEIGCDVLLVFDVDRTVKSGKQALRFNFTAIDLLRHEVLLRSSKLTLTAIDDPKKHEPFQKLQWEWRDLLEDGLSPGAWPVTLRKSIAAKRVASLGESNDPFPPRALGEMNFYRNQRLVDDQQVLLALRGLISEDQAMALMLGEPKKRGRVLRPWLPPEDVERFVEEAELATTRLAASEDD